MRIVSWNVNGLRSVDRNRGFRRFLTESGADVFAVQEVRARAEDLPRRLTDPRGYHFALCTAEKRGYSGVALYARRQPVSVRTHVGEERFDREGRFVLAEWDECAVASVYFPNGSGPNRDHSRVPYKLDFYRRVFDLLEPMRASSKPLFVVGDYNTAHQDIDLARPKQNKKTSGFLLPEREVFGEVLDRGWSDTFRQRNSEGGHYTWWSQRQGVRQRNIGWRIDYVLANPAGEHCTSEAFIWPRKRGSDHCPVGVDCVIPGW